MSAHGAPERGSEQGGSSRQRDRIKVGFARRASVLEEALLDFGKRLLERSVEEGVQFHRTMLGLSATFTTLMTLVLGSTLAIAPAGGRPSAAQAAALALPVCLMLLASVCFALGYYPRRCRMQLSVARSIEEVRSRLIRLRYRWAVVGVTLFVLSILSALAEVVLLRP